MKTPALKALLQGIEGTREGYVAALTELKRKFDRPQELRQIRLRKLDALKAPTENHESLDLYCCTVTGLFTTYRMDGSFSATLRTTSFSEKLPSIL